MAAMKLPVARLPVQVRGGIATEKQGRMELWMTFNECNSAAFGQSVGESGR
jgi:hypothetical protein